MSSKDNSEEVGLVVAKPPVPKRRRSIAYTDSDENPANNRDEVSSGNGVAVPDNSAPVPRDDAAPVMAPPAFTMPPLPTAPAAPQSTRPPVNVTALGTLFAPPPDSPQRQRKRETEVLGLRTDAEVVEWWRNNLLIAQGCYKLPDGLIPDIAAKLVVAGFHDIVRRAVFEEHGIDIGLAAQSKGDTESQ